MIIFQKNLFRLLNEIIFAACILCSFYTVAASQNIQKQSERGHNFLQKIAHSDTLSFSAITTFERLSGRRKNNVSRFEVIRIGRDKGRWHTLIPEDQSNAIDILVDNVFYETYTDNDKIEAWPRRTRGLYFNIENIALILNNYSVTFLSDELIQDFPVDVVKISPRQRDRSWIKVWVHKSNGFIFNMEQYDLDNERLYFLERKEVVFNFSVDPKLFEVNFTGEVHGRHIRKEYESIADLQNEWNMSFIAPKVNPPGFVLKEIAVHMDDMDDDEPVFQYYYTDGIISYSLFQRKSERDDKEMRIDRQHGDLYISARKNGIYYRMDGDINQIDRDVIVQSFESIQPVKRED